MSQREESRSNSINTPKPAARLIDGDKPDIEKEAAITECPKPSDENATSHPEPPYSIFSTAGKRFMTFIAALTTLIPPFSSSMYYPVITMLATDLNVSINDINLTITTYLLLQGIAPSFVAGLSDERGRRPAFIISFTIYIAGCVGAAVKGNYALLMVMRCLQSVGSSGTIALSFAIVSDIVTSAQRGSYVSYVQMGWMIGPALGPVIGGLLSQAFGWRSIFWFLTVFGALVFITVLVFLPETSRKIVGNGSVPPPAWNISLLAYIHTRRQRKAGTLVERKEAPPKTHFNPLGSLALFADKETAVFLLYGGSIYANTYFVLATMPPQLQAHYGFDTLHISLCFLASGFGTMAAVLIVGRLLDWNFRQHAAQAGLEISLNRQQDLRAFPIELARLQVSLPLLVVSAVAFLAYGWSLQAGAPLAVPLVFLFITAFGNSGAYSGFNNLTVDLNREKPGTAAAAMNLARNWLGAGGVAFANPLTNAVGMGWASVVVVGVWAVFLPFVFWAVRCGPQWREQKLAKEQEKKAEMGE